MYVKAGVVKFALKKKTPFFYKRKLLRKSKVWQCVINKEEAKPCHRHPEKHLVKNLHGLLKRNGPGILHKAGCDYWEMPLPKTLHKKELLHIC
jgi:hypothetical protein